MRDNSEHTTSANTLLQLMANRRRRDILEHLIAMPSTVVSFDELIEDIGTVDPPSGRSYRDANSRALAELTHVQLPILAESNVIEYDLQSETIRYYPSERVERLFRYVSEEVVVRS